MAGILRTMKARCDFHYGDRPRQFGPVFARNGGSQSRMGRFLPRWTRGFRGCRAHPPRFSSLSAAFRLHPRESPGNEWTHWDLNPGPSACEADVMPLHHVPACNLRLRRPTSRTRGQTEATSCVSEMLEPRGAQAERGGALNNCHAAASERCAGISTHAEMQYCDTHKSRSV